MNKRSVVLLLIVFSLFINIFPSIKVLGEEEPTLEIEEKLNLISEEEKEILETLFKQVQEIEELERENIRLNLEIEEMKKGIEDLEKRIFNAEEGYEKNLMALEAILKSYQRMGAGSYLEIILESESLQDFLRRVNILRDLSRNSKELLDTIERDKKILEEEKMELDIKLSELEEKQDVLVKTIEMKQELVREKEEYLESLAEDRALYEERLEYISLIMVELKEIIGEFTVEFAKVIQTGKFPQDAVKESLTLRGLKGTIDEKTFNNIIKEQENLPPMEFKFMEGSMEMNVPEKQLYLVGNFDIEDDRVLTFQPEEGTFFGMPLEKGTIDELFEEGDFLLDLEPLIGKNTVKSVEIKKGFIEILIGIKLF
ncbi:MAG TPA: hypothetical protein VFC60_04115 [Tissierellaceae bacterium]|nr:hypothetical protein [Tissierellaceae bacterium]